MRRMYDENQIRQIAASGNLYVHTVYMTNNAVNALKAYANIYSTDSTPITSLSILKSYLGNQFEYPVNGYDEGTTQPVWMMNETGILPGDGSIVPWSPGITFSDTVVKL